MCKEKVSIIGMKCVNLLTYQIAESICLENATNVNLDINLTVNAQLVTKFVILKIVHLV